MSCRTFSKNPRTRGKSHHHHHHMCIQHCHAKETYHSRSCVSLDGFVIISDSVWPSSSSVTRHAIFRLLSSPSAGIADKEHIRSVARLLSNMQMANLRLFIYFWDRSILCVLPFEFRCLSLFLHFDVFFSAYRSPFCSGCFASGDGY